MRKAAVVFAILSLLAIPLLAQDHPKAEVFGGYQFTHINYGFPNTPAFTGTGLKKAENYNGWNAALTVWVNNWLGATADFSGAYRGDSTVTASNSIMQHTFMFGPTVALRRNEKFTPFAHALFGGAHCSTGIGSGKCFGFDSNSFAFALGGGLDVGSKRIAFRVGQFDYIRTGFDQNIGLNHQNEFRYSAGVIFRF